MEEASTTNFADLQREDKPLRDEDIQGTYIDHKDRSVRMVEPWTCMRLINVTLGL